MKTKSKVLVAIVMALLVAVPLISNALTVEASDEESVETSDLPQGERLIQLMYRLSLQRRGVVIRWFLSEAEAITIDGEVIAHFRNIMVISSGGERLNVVLPRAWNIDSEVINVTQMFDEYLKPGDMITIKALKAEKTNKHDITFMVILAYEIANGDQQFYAVLPFNIDTGD